jgi:peptidoglycan/xylan/chitin deacetylase (PgdA/CDA1 family)
VRPPRRRAWPRVTLTLVLTVAALLTCAYGSLQLSRSRSYQVFGGIVDRVATVRPVVALTFDDGPDPAGAAAVLRTLAAEHVRGTFYLIGRDLQRYPSLGARIAAAGHELGDHSYSHQRMVLVSGSWVAGEVTRTDALIRGTGYRGPITFRPPNGKKLLALPAYLRAHHRTTVTWDVEPNSYPAIDASAAATASYTIAHVRPGSIVDLHVMYPGRAATRAALRPMIDGLRARGYRFVTVSELLRLRGRGGAPSA